MKKPLTSLNQMIVLFALCSLAIVLQSCKEKESAPAEFNLTAAKAEIEEANRIVMDLFAKGDSVGLANAYAIDGKLMSAGAPAAVGRANIQKAWNDMIGAGLTKVDLKLENVFGAGDLIAEEGVATLYVNNDIVGVEKYIVLWKKEDGKWKLFRDIFNSNLPSE